MIPQEVKNTIEQSKDSRDRVRVLFIAGGILAANTVGLSDIELIKATSESLSYAVGFFPLHDPLSNVQSFFAGATSYTAAAGLGLFDSMGDSAEMLSRHIHETVQEMGDWAGSRAEPLRQAFHHGISESRQFARYVAEQSGDIADNGFETVKDGLKGIGKSVPFVGKLLAGFTAAWGVFRSMREAYEFGIKQVRKLPFWPKKNEPAAEEVRDSSSQTIIHNMSINISIGGDPAVQEAGSQVEEASTPDISALSKGKINDKRKINIKIDPKLKKEVADHLMDKGVSKDAILWISDRLKETARDSLMSSASKRNKNWDGPDLIDDASTMRLNGKIISQEQSDKALESWLEKMEAQGSREQSSSGPEM